jgi:hypothetical protein
LVRPFEGFYEVHDAKGLLEDKMHVLRAWIQEAKGKGMLRAVKLTFMRFEV